MGKRVIFNLEAAKRQAGTKARVMEVEHMPSKLPACAWCRKKGIRVQWEFIQEGMWWSDFLLICYCAKCKKSTIVCYQSEEEPTHEP